MQPRRFPLPYLAALTAVLACSNDVQQVDGSGGSSSSTNDAVVGTSSVGTGSTTGTTTNGSTTATSTSSGMSECEMACAHVQDCTGFDLCGQIPQLDCSNPAADCPGACINDATCNEIIALAMQQPAPALQACLGTCGGGGGGTGTGGGSAQSCGQCVFGANCTLGCMGDSECQAWAQCALQCTTPSCYAACNDAHPTASAKYTPYYACLCTACDTDCGATMDPCSQPLSGAGGGGGGLGAGGN